MSKARITNSDILNAIEPLQVSLAAAAGAVAKVDKAVGELTVQIRGNGGKGVLQRLDGHDQVLGDVQKWQQGRPIVCPATAKEVTRKIMLIVAMIAGGLTVISVGASLFIKPLGVRQLEAEVQKVEPVLNQLERLNKLLGSLEKIAP